MIPHINDRLNNWAAWCERRASGALGYPKQAAFTRLRVSEPPSDGILIIDEDAWEIERAIASLDDGMKRVAMAFYRRGTTVAQAREMLGASKATAYRRLHELHVAVLDWLLGDYAQRGDRRIKMLVRESQDVRTTTYA